MTSFEGGPAGGATLLLRRAPVFLRVVIGPRGKVDALDQLEDVPADGETVHVYERFGPRGHVCLRPGGCHEYGTYRHLPHVDGELLRDTAAWRAWASTARPSGELAAAP